MKVGQKVYVVDTKDTAFALNQEVEYAGKSGRFPDTHWLKGEVNGMMQVQGLKSRQISEKPMMLPNEKR